MRVHHSKIKYCFNFTHVCTHTHRGSECSFYRENWSKLSLKSINITLAMDLENAVQHVKIYILLSIFTDNEDSLEFQIHLGLNLMHGYKVQE